MSMELTPDIKEMLIEGAKALGGADRRLFMARAVRAMGFGGQMRAEKELGWNRNTILKGLGELDSNTVVPDGRVNSGRKPVEVKLPTLRDALKEIVDSQSQTDPSFKTTRLYRRLSVPEVVRQLIEQKNFSKEELPSEETIRKRLNEMGYRPMTVQKSRPKKKIPETDEIFDCVHLVNAEADASPNELRISMDAKATVKVGPFSRGGKSRVQVEALDHDFEPIMTLTPLGLLVPEHDETTLYFVDSKVTAGCLVDVLTWWWRGARLRFPDVDRLVLNLDNGPECHSRRTWFIKRLVSFCDIFQVDLRLAYYPPYHSKYNSIERVWAKLEHQWNGGLLDSEEAVLGYAESMTWRGVHPDVRRVRKQYTTGKSLKDHEMAKLEERLERWPGVEKWLVDISCQ
jgi:hypothetical protein